METKEIKLPEQDLVEINNLRVLIRENVDSLGNLSIRKHFLLKEISTVDGEIKASLEKTEELNLMEKTKVNEIVERFGEGKLDFETGIYYTN
jgi:hypothetical protein